MVPTRALSLSLALGSVALAAPVGEPLRVVTTTTDLLDLARAVGGDRVTVVALARGTEDPHTVVPKPSLMGVVRDAGLFIEIGLDLELWAENVLDGAGNPGVRRGAPGHHFAAEGLSVLERPAVLSRAEGDLHPNGNPHCWLDPLRAKRMAAGIATALAHVDPAGTETYQAGAAAFARAIDAALYGPRLLEAFGGRSDVLDRLCEAGTLHDFLAGRTFKGEPLVARLGGWLALAAPIRGRPFVFHHQSWPYLAERFGLRVVGHVEENPAIRASAAHRDRLPAVIRAERVRVVGVESFFTTGPAEGVAQAAGGGVRVVTLPLHVGGVPGADSYVDLLTTILTRLVEADRAPAEAGG